MRRRAAVEPVIGHLKDDHRMRFSLLLRWFKRSLRALLLILARASWRPASPKSCSETFFTTDYFGSLPRKPILQGVGHGFRPLQKEKHGHSSFNDHVRDNDKDNDPRDRAGQETQCTKHDCLVGSRIAQLLTITVKAATKFRP
jgi:hypothetical protein